MLDIPLLILAGAVVLFFIILFNYIPVGLWISAVAAGVKVSLFSLLAMRLRRVPPNQIILPLIKADKAGIEVNQNQLEAHFLAGGNVNRVVDALIAADKARIALPFDRAAAIDLAGRDVLDAVKVSVNPRVIQTPNVSAVAKDGIELIATARITVRANLERLVGGAGEETIIARVGEGIVSAIGSADTHLQVLESPQRISKLVLSRGLDASTAFEILSIDIADINVGENIGARLEADKAESLKRVAQAKAEERRAMAVALEQENIAKVKEMDAKLVEAKALVPQAMAKAFDKGNLGIMDYQRIQNIQSDTDMRNSLASSEDRGTSGKMPPAT